MNKVSPLARACALLLVLAATGVQAQSSCSSDGQPQPVGLLERFVNADCQSCWSDARTRPPAPGVLALDWIVPGSRGDKAPLSAAASRDALARLRALGRPGPPRASTSKRKAAQGGSRQVRVAHGLVFNGYIGTSIELKPGGGAGGAPWQAWLLLVESVPAGAEGSPVARNIVRNVLQLAWGSEKPPSKEEQKRFFESRPMSIPEGTNTARLRVVGWVEDQRGQIRGIAESKCVPEAKE